jgi:protein CpxP
MNPFILLIYERGARMKGAQVLTTITILALSVTMALAVQAGPFGSGPRGHGPGGFQGLLALGQLDLSAPQRQAVSDIFNKYADDRVQAREGVQVARQRMAALMTADAFDEAAIRQGFQGTSAAMEEAVVLRARMFAEIKGVLDPDQLEQLAEIQHNREERMAPKKRHRGFGFRHSGRDTWLPTDSE